MLKIFQSLPSTNEYCLNFAQTHPGERLAVLAHQQTAGRGRQGKPWVSAQSENLYLSYLRPMVRQGPLSLVVGLVLARELETLGYADLKLKWPNDLVVGEAKLAGILIEGPVIGLGLNFVEPQGEIDQPVTALASLGCPLPDKIRFAEGLIQRLEEAFIVYEDLGFTPFMEAWARFDALKGQRVAWTNGSQQGVSVALGVNQDGHLLIQDPPHHLFSGSVRKVLD